MVSLATAMFYRSASLNLDNHGTALQSVLVFLCVFEAHLEIVSVSLPALDLSFKAYEECFR